MFIVWKTRYYQEAHFFPQLDLCIQGHPNQKPNILFVETDNV